MCLCNTTPVAGLLLILQFSQVGYWGNKKQGVVSMKKIISFIDKYYSGFLFFIGILLFILYLLTDNPDYCTFANSFFLIGFGYDYHFLIKSRHCA